MTLEKTKSYLEGCINSLEDELEYCTDRERQLVVMAQLDAFKEVLEYIEKCCIQEETE